MKLEILFLLFIIYSFIGWIMEICVSFYYNKKFVDRGFLVGPYCPIYGIGAILIIVLLKRYSQDIAVLFMMSMFLCSVLEYFTSLFMELVFKARWWDYSNRKYNINGRICLETMIPFGILGCLMNFILNPAILSFLDLIPNNALKIVSVIIAVMFIIDNIISFKIIFNLKTITKNLRKDCTEEISKKVREVLLSKNALHRRLMKAFPKIEFFKGKRSN